MKVLILHAYSATNAGDGLLVHETLNLLTESFGDDCDITIAALHPHTFRDLDGHSVVDAGIRWCGHTKEMKFLLRNIDTFELIVGVGGGYLRFGRPLEALKTALAHGAQVLAAARASCPTIYLPQSIGPLRFGTRFIARTLMSRMTAVYLRDDRSVSELDVPNARRSSDLALISQKSSPRSGTDVIPVPVLTVRAVHGKLSDGVVSLAGSLQGFDGYVQSTGAGNDDTNAMRQIGPARILTREEFLDGSRRRVVVAVRLHAAIMALNAGHWVVHLAYERKGFGAFDDLGLADYVHNNNDFDTSKVEAQVMELLTSTDARQRYDELVQANRPRLTEERLRIISELKATSTIMQSGFADEIK